MIQATKYRLRNIMEKAVQIDILKEDKEKQIQILVISINGLTELVSVKTAVWKRDTKNTRHRMAEEAYYAFGNHKEVLVLTFFLCTF